MTYPGAMDTFARGLRAADKILDEGVIAGAVKERYSSYDSGLGAKIEKGETSLEEMEVCVCICMAGNHAFGSLSIAMNIACIR